MRELNCVGDEELVAISTGFPEVDRYLHGGWVRPQVHLVVGRSGEGVSSLMLNMVVAALKDGRRVGMVQMHLHRRDVLSRLTAIHTGIPANRVYDRKYESKDEKSVCDAASELFSRRLELRAKGPMQEDDLADYLDGLANNFACDVVFVDSFHEVIGPFPESVALSLDGAIDGPGIPVVLSQRVRSNWSIDPYTPDYVHLEETTNTAESAPVVLALQRGPTGPDGQSAGLLHILKNRILKECREGIGIVGTGHDFRWAELGTRSEMANSA